MRATWLTDIHLNFLRRLQLKAFFTTVKEERPDVVLVTGDIAESDCLLELLDGFAAVVERPIYYVLGNHDYYRSSIASVRAQVTPRTGRPCWLPASEPVWLTQHMVMIGVDGWGDARCGNLDSKVQLSDWQLIEDFQPVRYDRQARLALLQELGAAEAALLASKLDELPHSDELLVLTHVPPFAEACWYAGEPSEPAWLPWFTCIATGEVLRAHAAANPSTNITVLCGHTHGLGTYQAAPNLVVRTGGWPANVEGYGNPIVQLTLDL